jgi:hypothetical protein
MDVTSKKSDALFCPLNRLLDRRTRRAAFDVVDREHGIEGQGLGKVIVKSLMDLLEICQGQFL